MGVLSLNSLIRLTFEVDLILTACNCDASGITGEPGSDRCDQTTGRCDCKANVTGRTCGECKDGFWNLTKPNPYGCQGRCEHTIE